MARNTPTPTSPAERVATLEAQLADLPRLEAEALDAGDEDTLTRLSARSRILSRELIAARLDALTAERGPISDQITAINTELLATTARIGEFEYAATVYNQAADELRSLVANRRNAAHVLMDRVDRIDRELVAAETALASNGMAVTR